DQLRAFIQNSTNSELLAKLIFPITWQTGAVYRESLLTKIEFKLVTLGRGRPIPPPAAASATAINKLFLEAFEVATREKDRALDRARLLKVFDEATGVWVPLGALWSRPLAEPSAVGADRQSNSAFKNGAGWLNIAVPVISGAIVWWSADVNPLKLLAVS